MPNLGKTELKRLIYIAYVLVAFLFGYFYKDITPTTKILQVSLATSSEPVLLGTFKVSRIVDGDTVHVLDANNQEEVVRLLSINTPEIHNASDRQVCLGTLASDYTKDHLLDKTVDLYVDETQGRRDKYDRLLAYVHLSGASSTHFFNEDLVSTGNAKVFYTRPATLMYDKYVDLEKVARARQLGMWNPELCK
jgi:micrococcal nuclease